MTALLNRCFPFYWIRNLEFVEIKSLLLIVNFIFFGGVGDNGEYKNAFEGQKRRMLLDFIKHILSR